MASVDDRGPWYYVLDHGKSRTSERPKFGYNGSLVPFRVSPDRLVPAHIPKPDYYATGQPEVRARAEHARSHCARHERAHFYSESARVPLVCDRSPLRSCTQAERRHAARNTPPVHSEKEIRKMRKVNRLGREILDEAHRAVRPGVTTDEIDRIVHECTVRRLLVAANCLRRVTNERPRIRRRATASPTPPADRPWCLPRAVALLRFPQVCLHVC